MRAISIKLLPLACIAGLAALTGGCGDLIRQDRSSSILVIDALQAASGASDTLRFSGTLQSDVETGGGVFSDPGQVTMRVIPKDLASPIGPSNTVTITRYLVKFRRTDGRDTPGVDVPYPFDSAMTFTVTSPTNGTTGSFELIRHNAKFEQPLLGLVNSFVTLSTIADITFVGRDQAGRDLSATGSIGVQFGNFADPD